MSERNVAETYHQVANDDGSQKERDAGRVTDQHAIPHGFDPFAAEYAEHDHKRVHEVGEVPSWHFLTRKAVDVI